MRIDTGVTRCVDKLGRLVIPKEVRLVMGLGVGEPVHMYVEDDKIIVEKHKNSCMLCGSFDSIQKFNDRLICKKCVAEIKENG